MQGVPALAANDRSQWHQPYADTQQELTNGQVWWFIVRFETKNVSGLAFKKTADGLQGGKADCLGLARLENGEVLGSDPDSLRYVVQTHLTLRHHHIQVHDYRHMKHLPKLAFKKSADGLQGAKAGCLTLS